MYQMQLREKKKEKEKDPHVKVREKYNLFNVSDPSEASSSYSQVETKQTLDKKPPKIAEKPTLYSTVRKSTTEELSIDKKSSVTTELKKTPESRKRVSTTGYGKLVKTSTSSEVVEVKTEKEKEERNSSAVTTAVKQESEEENEEGSHVKLRDRFNLFGEYLKDSLRQSPDGLKKSVDNEPASTAIKLYTYGGKSTLGGASTLTDQRIKREEKLLTSSKLETPTEKENGGGNSTVITHTIIKDFEELGKDKDSRVKMRERFNLRDALKDFSCHSSNGSKNSEVNNPPPIPRRTYFHSEGNKPSTEEIKSPKESLETSGTSSSKPLNGRFFKVFGNPVENQEKHSLSSKELKTHTEKKKEGENSQTIIHKHYNTITNHNNYIKKPEEPKHVDPTFRTYKDFKNHSAQTTVNSVSSSKHVIATNEEDLARQAAKCKELDMKFKNDAARKDKKKKKRGSLGNAWFCCGECCIQGAECL